MCHSRTPVVALDSFSSSWNYSLPLDPSWMAEQKHHKECRAAFSNVPAQFLLSSKMAPWDAALLAALLCSSLSNCCADGAEKLMKHSLLNVVV